MSIPTAGLTPSRQRLKLFLRCRALNRRVKCTGPPFLQATSSLHKSTCHDRAVLRQAAQIDSKGSHKGQKLVDEGEVPRDTMLLGRRL